MVGPIPFDLARGNGRQRLGQGAKAHLPYRQPHEPLIAQHPDIQLAAFDIFLDQCIGADLFVHELYALAQVRDILDHRGLRDAE